MDMVTTRYDSQLIKMREDLLRAGWRVANESDGWWSLESTWSPRGFQLELSFRILTEHFNFSLVEARAGDKQACFASMRLGRHWEQDFPKFLANLAEKRDQDLASRRQRLERRNSKEGTHGQAGGPTHRSEDRACHSEVPE